MLTITHFRASEALSLLCFIALVTGGCGSAPKAKRPQNVPADATHALGNKGVGWWHNCDFAETDHRAHCTIWNAGGLVLYEGVFLPYDRGPLEARDLKVVYNPRWGDNAQFICLENDRVLIPASEFDRLSTFADGLTGKRTTPN
jgi:hypothetical protein